MAKGTQKPKIAILGVKFYPSRGGVSRIVEDTLIELKDRYDFTIYCYKTPEAENYLPGVRAIQFPKIPGGAFGVFFYYLRCTLHALRHGNYDLVHVHKTDAAFFVPMLTRKFKTIATSHEAPYRRDKWSGIGKAYFRLMERIFMRSHARLTSISKPLSAYYEQTYGRPVEYIPNGVEVANQFDYDAADRVLAEHGVKGEFMFFAARRIMGTKGAHHMLQALRQIGYKGSVVIAGDLSQLPAYTKQLKDLSKGLDVKFIGYISSKATLMALVDRSKFFIFPSETEGMSIMLLEVGSVGTPLVCSDIPENTSVFDDEEVLYFRNKDAADLAAKLEWAFAHPNEMEDKARAARQRVLDEYDRAVVVENYIRLYDDMLSAAPVL
ncbi:MAG: glycosyltransferase family 4 protein [Bacteroidia bacterium]